MLTNLTTTNEQKRNRQQAKWLRPVEAVEAAVVKLTAFYVTVFSCKLVHHYNSTRDF